MTGGGERAYRWAVACLTVIAFLVSLSWSTSLPFFSGPDESRHLNSVARLIDGGGWPLPYDAPVLGSVRDAVVESGLSTVMDVDSLPVETERGPLIGDASQPDSGRDAMVQHPPGYYLVASAVIYAVGGGELRWDLALLVLRAVSAGIAALAIPSPWAPPDGPCAHGVRRWGAPPWCWGFLDC